MKEKIDKLISKVEAKKRKEALAEAKEDRESEEEFQKLLKYEKSKHNEKIELLDKILKWAADFSKSPRFKKIMKILDCYSDLIIFYSSWGHVDDYEEYKKGEEDPGRWARICIDKKGNLEYKWGYKWMGMQHFYLNKKNLEKIKYKFLKELWDHINSKKVLDDIESEIKRSA